MIPKISAAMSKGHYDEEARTWVKTPSLEEAERAFQITKYLLAHGANVNANYEDYDWRGCGSQETAFEKALEVAVRYPKFGGELLDQFLKARHTYYQIWNFSGIEFFGAFLKNE